jgi:stage V sporulation protein SpoVS
LINIWAKPVDPAALASAVKALAVGRNGLAEPQ